MKETGRFIVLAAAGALLFACGCVQEKKTQDVISSTSSGIVATSLPAGSSTTTVSSITATSTTIAAASTTTAMIPATDEPTTTTESSPAATLAPRPGLTADIKLPRDTFHSGDLMAIDVLVNSPGKLENIGVRVYGIYANGYRLNQSTTATLVPGLNDILFTYKAPPCNTCAGIAAGKYVLKAEIVYEGRVAVIAMKDVNLKQ